MTGGPRYYARSASDTTDDWPFWFVADYFQGGLNVVGPLMDQLFPGNDRRGRVFLSRYDAESLAAMANGKQAEP